MSKITRSIMVALFVALLLAAAAAAGLDRIGRSSGGSASLGSVASANAKYKSLALAQKAGYGLLKDKKGISCIAMTPMPGMAMGAMGVHYAKSALVGDGKLDPTTPEALVYAPAAGGKLQLAAVEYVVLKAAWDAKHTSDPALFGHRFNETYGGNRFGLPAFYSLHVWLFEHNPSGRFSMWNPLVHCGGKA